MSERGSLTTGFIYCNQCVTDFRRVFEELNYPYRQFSEEMTAYCVRLSSLHAGGELEDFEMELYPALKRVWCGTHYIDLVVLCDNGDLFRCVLGKAAPREMYRGYGNSPIIER